MKTCSICKQILPENKFGVDKTKKDSLRYQCKQCHHKQRKLNYNANKIKIRSQQKKYYNIHKLEIAKQKKKYRKIYAVQISKKHESYYQNNKQKFLELRKLYSQTPKGKEVSNKHTAKRRRNLGWIKLYDNPFNADEPIDWHHIDNEYVVALPRDLHQLYMGKNHKENLKPIIKQIYKEIEKCQMKKVK